MSKKQTRVQELRERDGDYCSICGLLMNFNLAPTNRRAPTIDHIVPKAAGGRDNIENEQLAHYYPCNAKKGAKYGGIDWEQVRDEEARLRAEQQTDKASSGGAVLVWSSKSA